MVAKMWAFDPAEVRLPPGAHVDLYLSSVDVTHGLYIEGTNVNLMAVPGSVNAAQVTFDHEGEYHTICHEYCGAAHQQMAGKFVITAAAERPAPAPAAAAPQAPAAGAAVAAGRALFEQKGCVACHSVDGSTGVGPTLKGIYGRQTHLADGSVRTADDAYLEHKLRDPDDTLVDGYDAIMPELPLTDDEVKELIDYIRSLS
jgi:cytochrome c oxidase subunit 2